MKIAWIGLGTMGGAMAGHLVGAGHDVAVFNRTPGRDQALVDAGARSCASPAEAASGAQLVFTCVSDSPDVEHVVFGPGGVAESVSAGTVLVDCSTISPAITRGIAERLTAIGVGAVDAPVSGGSEGAVKGTLSAFVGGVDADVQAAQPALEAFCATITHLGPPGAGQAAKAVNQVLIAGTYATLGEALVLGEREGLPVEALVAALSGGAAQSWVLQNRAGNVIADDYPLGFRVELHLKDLRIALAEARELGVPMAITEIIAGQERSLTDAGFGAEDLSNLARVPRGSTG